MTNPNLSEKQFGVPATKHFKGGVDTQAPGYWNVKGRGRTVTLHPDDAEELIATQKELDPAHPAWTHAVEDKNHPVSLIASESGTYVNDGHHRIAGAFSRGESIKARLHTSVEDW